MIAARNAFPQYLAEDGPFVAMGHSQGAAAAWAFAERQSVSPVPGYRGTVAFAPPPDTIAEEEQALLNPLAHWSKLASAPFQKILAIDATTAIYPPYNWKGFTNTTSQLFHDIYERSEGCLPTASVLFAGSVSYTHLTLPTKRIV